jgi:hypothetical protein
MALRPMHERAPIGRTIAAFAAGSTACGLLMAWREASSQSSEAVLTGVVFACTWALLATAIFMSAVVLLAWGAERPLPRTVVLKASIAGALYFPVLIAIVLVMKWATERLNVPRSVMNATTLWTMLLGGIVVVTPAALACCVFWRRGSDFAVEQGAGADEGRPGEG